MDCCQYKTPWYKKIISTLLGTGNCHGEVKQDTRGLEKIALSEVRMWGKAYCLMRLQVHMLILL